MALGATDGLQPVVELLEAGLLYPLLDSEPGAPPSPVTTTTVKTFEQWLAFPGPGGLTVFAHPLIASRALGEDLGLPDLSQGGEQGPAHESDGLEWVLRLAALWQQVTATPLRRTLQGGFFKRDADRLAQEPLLNGPPADQLADLPDQAFFVAALAEGLGLILPVESDWRAAPLPAAWEEGPSFVLDGLWRALLRQRAWDPQAGARSGDAAPGDPFPSAYLLSLLLLARLPDGAWARVGDIQEWLTLHHPYWSRESMRPSKLVAWAEAFLLGVAYHLRLTQAAREPDGEWSARLTSWGRWLLGMGPAPTSDASFPQTLLVQPNLEVLAYRQGLTPALIARLTRFATWKAFGAACTLQLEPESVYRALEAGESFESIRRTLEQHGTRAVPDAVLDALRTWSNKRDRLTVYPSGLLMEFATAEDLTEALARGVPAVRLSDRLAVAADESALDFRHFRLTGTRDYGLPPEKCVEVEDDGVTLVVDGARSDLLLETELPRLAERLDGPATGPRRYRLTPASLAAACEGGWSAESLETWFLQRTGDALPPAARLLLLGDRTGAARLRRRLVVYVPGPAIADGLLQWPPTRDLIAERLGPSALAVEEDRAAALREQLRMIGIACEE
jgi:hypothetical protein